MLPTRILKKTFFNHYEFIQKYLSSTTSNTSPQQRPKSNVILPAMKKFFVRHILAIIGILLTGIVIIVWTTSHTSTPTWITDTVTTGTVQKTISVSGAINAVETADLSFSVPGILGNINVTEGDFVSKGQFLAELIHSDLHADMQDAEATLLIAKSDYDQLINGIRTEERDVSKTTASIAKENLDRITDEQNNRVQNAYNTLLSSDIKIRPVKKDNNDIPPTISGTYTCAEGTYTLDLFRSNAQSGYSYRLSGIETGTYTAYTESASPLGKCGLSIQFATNEIYRNETWYIDIPNTQSSSYTTNENAYTISLTQRANAIREAEQELTLAEQQNILENAAPREEEINRAQARVQQAEARISAITAKINERMLTAPFDGTISNIEPVIGESVGNTPIITMVSSGAFALNALIPEIDITEIKTGQKANVVFDAQKNESIDASIIFVSPLAKVINGVSYFEAKIILNENAEWIRSGLNADINIIIEKRENVLRIPKRFLITENDKHFVLIPEANTATRVPVVVNFEGNDGYVQIEGIRSGDIIIAP